VPCSRRILPVITACCPFLLEPQAINLALVVGAILARRSLCLTTLARAFPVPAVRAVPAPKHELLHRLKRLSRFLSNEQIDPVAIQVACIPTVVAKLGTPRWLGLVLDWTSFDVTLPRLAGGGVRKYQVLTIAAPCRRRALPLLSVTYERDKLPSQGSQHRWEEAALARVLAALPKGVRPVVLGDRGFGRAGLLEWLAARKVDYVLRLRRGAQITDGDGRRWRLGEEALARGQQRWRPGVRYGAYHDRPRDLVINLACSWKRPKRARAKRAGKEYAEPWYLATSLGGLTAAVAWYRQRMWIEATFKDGHSIFGLDQAQIGSAARLGRLVAALSLALAFLHLLALPRSRALPRGWAASVTTRGTASLVALALAWLDEHRDFPPGALSLPKAA
jgi:hypothetical protein